MVFAVLGGISASREAVTGTKDGGTFPEKRGVIARARMIANLVTHRCARALRTLSCIRKSWVPVTAETDCAEDFRCGRPYLPPSAAILKR
jgi:hypothetical protein